ncbi:MAG: WG repeat-containing protein [Crocinitomicaceae bacterium]|nr:WG repeat-containing protein [Crocinitomicaceae bacterium]
MRFYLVIIWIGISFSVWGTDILFPVAKNGKWGLINSNGDVVLQPLYDYIEYNSTGKKFIYYFHGKKGLIDLSGKKLSEPIYENLQFLDTNWVAYDDGLKWHLFKSDKEILADNFDSIANFDKDIIQLFQGDSIRLFHRNGNVLSKKWYLKVGPFYKMISGLTRQKTFDLLSHETLEILVSDLTGFFDATENYITGRHANGCRIYHAETGQPASDFYDEIKAVNENYFICKKSNDTKLLQLENKKLFPLPDLDEAVQIRYPYLFYLKNEQTGIWNFERGTLIAEPQFDGVSLTDGLFYVRLNGAYGILSTDGKEILPPVYSSVTAYDNLYLVSQNNLYGLTTRSGKKIKDCVYKEIRVYDKNVKCFQGKKLDLLNIDANGTVQGETSYTDYMTISFDQEKTPGPRSESIEFSGNRTETSRAGYEALGWFQKETERQIGDSVKIIKGNWGLRYDKDSIAIQNRFPDIIVQFDYDLTECYVQKLIRYGIPGYEAKINEAQSYFFMSSNSFATGFGFFRLANHKTKKLLPKVLFQSIKYNDFKKYKLARALTKNLCLIDTSGQIVFDSLMYFGNYKEDILTICEGGKYEMLKYNTSTCPQSTSNFLNSLDMGDYTAGKNEAFFSINNGDWYFINARGKKINTEPFDFIKPFNQGRAIVSQNGKWGVVDTAMNIVVPIEYNYINEFFVNGEQFFEVSNPVYNTYLYTRSTGNLQKTDISKVYHYCEGKWFVQNKAGSIALMDTNMNAITGYDFSAVTPFEDGFAMVTKRGKKSVIDLNGKEYLQGYKARDMNYLGHGRFEIIQSKGSLIADISGDSLILPNQCKEVIESNKDFVIYKNQNKELQLYTELKIKKIPKDADIISYCLEDGTLLLKQDGSERIYSVYENRYLTKKMYNIEKIGKGFYLFRHHPSKKLGAVSLTGDTLIDPVYDEIDIQPNGWAVARVDKRTLIRIDMKGKALDDMKFTKYVREKDHYIFYTKDGIGLFDMNGKMILPCDYSRIEKYNSVFYKADDGQDLFYLDGRKVIPGEYSNYKGYSTSNMVVRSGNMDYLYTGYINKTLSFQNVQPINSDLFILSENNHRGVYNAAGKDVVPVRYHQLKVDRGYFQVRHFNSFGYFETTGKPVFDPIN